MGLPSTNGAILCHHITTVTPQWKKEEKEYKEFFLSAVSRLLTYIILTGGSYTDSHHGSLVCFKRKGVTYILLPHP